MPALSKRIVAIVPCNDLDALEAFYGRLGLIRPPAYRPAAHTPDDYRILTDGKSATVHLTKAPEGWVVPGRNPLGLYLYTEDVDAAAHALGSAVIEAEGPSHRPWGMYEFTASDPDGTLVRIGWPSDRLRDASSSIGSSQR
jgi:hypothetical protein